MKIISNSVEETKRIGEKLAKKLKKGDCVALVGDLGAGKTIFTKGIAEGLGVKNARYVNSPTFVIIKEYKGRLPLYHFDLYRLSSSSLIDAENFEEYFYGEGVTVIEWADKVRRLLPKRYFEINLKVTGEERREIKISKRV
ncbi:MAG: tRNA (adenosine(37)-N6)-threonylcarbamoyltransferase complex ATPase subunit type 1 TsaE [Candidatus Omnitrophota bacterium]|jgi:tRNA threonylcarbamoyladenosine biosynthesis protein TsaE